MESLSGYINAFALVILLSCFVKVLLSLSILRVGLGLTSSGIGIVMLALSLALSFLIMQPQIDSLGGLQAIINGQALKNSAEFESKIRPFLQKHSDPALTAKLSAIQKKDTPPEAVEVEKPADSFSLLGASFILTELKEGLELGILILIPFVIIDLLIANTLVLLGVKNISAEALALPCKLLLFFAVDGWNMIAEKIINGYS